MRKAKPNELCPCGSGRKYKKCCRDVGSILTDALAHHQSNDLASAVTLYTRVLERDPSQAGALHGLGMIALDRKDYATAADFLGQARVQRPDSALICCSLGGALQLCGRLEEAEACFVRAIEIDPSHADAQNNLGVIYQGRGRWEQAAVCFRRAVELRPDSAESHNNLGAALRMAGRAGEAIPELERAIALRPENACAQYNLGLALKSLGRGTEAAAAFAETVRLDPGNEAAAYFMQALQGDATPACTPAGLVANLFDGYAERFDHHLLDSLGYRTPVLLREAFAEAGGGGLLDILDVGCGTGLAGEAFREVAGGLWGADLSPRMVEKARARGIYAELWVEDILAALGRKPSRYDMVVAADVFVYVGDLDGTFAACHRALRTGGWFLFSVEVADGDNYVLSPAGRFQHPRRYVAGLAAKHGFRVANLKAAALRQEAGAPVGGELYVLRRN